MSTSLPFSTPAIPPPFDPAFRDNYADSLINGILAGQQASQRAFGTWTIEAPQDGVVYTLIMATRYAFDVKRAYYKSNADTATADIKINTTSITGLNALAITSTEANTDASGLNSAAQGDDLTITFSSIGANVDRITVTIYADRTSLGLEI